MVTTAGAGSKNLAFCTLAVVPVADRSVVSMLVDIPVDPPITPSRMAAHSVAKTKNMNRFVFTRRGTLYGITRTLPPTV